MKNLKLVYIFYLSPLKCTKITNKKLPILKKKIFCLSNFCILGIPNKKSQKFSMAQTTFLYKIFTKNYFCFFVPIVINKTVKFQSNTIKNEILKIFFVTQ